MKSFPKHIYLDHSATTPVLEVVAQRMSCAMQQSFFNPSAAYGPAVAVEKEMDACRQLLRDCAGAPGYDVVFTSGGTESDNLAILGVMAGLRGSRVCCFSAVEHPAVRESMRAAEALGHRVRVLPVDARGLLDLERCAECLDDEVALISCMQVNNEIGSVQLLAALSSLRTERCPDALLHVDGVQGFLRVPLNLNQLGIDLYSISAHKIHGPKGVGALMIRKGVSLKPLLHGGGQEGGLRSGTENVPGIVGFSAAVEALRAMGDLQQGLRANKLRLLQDLQANIPDVVVNGPDPHSMEAAPHILNLSFPQVRGEVMLHALEALGVYISTGAACSSRRQRHATTLAAMGISGARLEGTIRISLSPLNTPEEMDAAAQAIIDTHTQLKSFRRR